MKITEDFEKINEIKDLARRNMFGITPEDSDYIVENITDIFHAVYFVFDEWAKLKSALMILGSIPQNHPTEKSDVTDKYVGGNEKGGAEG